MGFISGQHSTFYVVYSKIPFGIAFCFLFLIKLFIAFLHLLPLLVYDIDAVSFIQQLSQSHTVSIIIYYFHRLAHLLNTHCICSLILPTAWLAIFCLLNINKASIILSSLKIHLSVNFDGSSFMPENSSTYFFWTYCQAPHWKLSSLILPILFILFFKTYLWYSIPL